LMDSFYFLKENHHIYVRRPDPNNTGAEGLMRLAASEHERARLREICHFQLLANAFCCLDRATEMASTEEGAADLMITKTIDHLIRNTIVGQALSWAETRGDLTLNRTPPKPVPV